MSISLSRPGSSPSRGGRLEWLPIAGLSLAILAAPATGQSPSLSWPHPAEAPVRGAVPQAIRQALEHEPDGALIAFYAGRGYRPLWIRGSRLDAGAKTLIAALERSDRDDLDPKTYEPDALRTLVSQARQGGPATLVRAELALSRALARYGAELRTPAPAVRLDFSDAALQPQSGDPRAVLEAAARSGSLTDYVSGLDDLNPIYARLRDGLAEALRPGSKGRWPIELIRANLERARALPAQFGSRYLLVDAPAQTLWFRDGDHEVGSMPVVVGKRSEPTPVMAGLVRYAVFHPYWNIPPDLVRDSVAPAVLRQGPSYLAAKRFEVLSDWSDKARVLAADEVDWDAVAAGRVKLRVRQTPGPSNMMGRVKFMFPNALGVYLHDTPLKSLFSAGERTFSSGCVRLQDANRLAHWLLPKDAADGPSDATPEQRVDLPQATPVYIVYLTLMPTASGLRRYPDIYGRDPALISQLKRAT